MTTPRKLEDIASDLDDRVLAVGCQTGVVLLYYLPDDYSQANNLAEQHPEKVEELQALWWEDARRYNVPPLLGGGIESSSCPRKVPRTGSRQITG